DNHGDIGASAGGSDGLFRGDTRFLSRLELLMGGMQPLLLGSNLRDDNSLLTVDLTNPDIFVDGHIVLAKDTLHIVRSIFLWHDSAYQRIGIRNYGARPVAMGLVVKFACDFVDLFELRGVRRKRRGNFESKLLGSDEVQHLYRGLDGVTRRVSVHFQPAPTNLVADEATYNLDVPAGGSCALFVTVNCDRPPELKVAPFINGLLSIRRKMRTLRTAATSIETSNPIFNELLRRATFDLHMLNTQTPQGPYPYAGIPWYSTT